MSEVKVSNVWVRHAFQHEFERMVFMIYVEDPNLYPTLTSIIIYSLSDSVSCIRVEKYFRMKSSCL